MPYEQNPMVRVFSLWENRKKKDDGTETRFWHCNIGGVKILMFRSKSNHPQAPMFDVCVTKGTPKPRGDDQPGARVPDDDNYGITAEAPQCLPPTGKEDEELPF